MPNPKAGTGAMGVGKAVFDVKAGKIDFRVDRYGIVHAVIGKVSFTPEMLKENAIELVTTLDRLKPTAAKGTYMRSITISSTMSPGIRSEERRVGKESRDEGS